MFLVSSCCCLCPIHWSQVLSREWRCSWSSADGRCSNYIWVINNFIACWGAFYIRGFTVCLMGHMTMMSNCVYFNVHPAFVSTGSICLLIVEGLEVIFCFSIKAILSWRQFLHFGTILYSAYILHYAFQMYLCSFKISIEMHIQWQIASG